MSLYAQNKAEHTASAVGASKNNNRQGGSTTNWRPRAPGGKHSWRRGSQAVSIAGCGSQAVLAVSKGVW